MGGLDWSTTQGESCPSVQKLVAIIGVYINISHIYQLNGVFVCGCCAAVYILKGWPPKFVIIVGVAALPSALV